MTRVPLARRPFSPFLRLLIGAGTTALLTEWARFQADVGWAVLPLGAGTVITLVSVVRGVRARRAWRRAAAAWAQHEAKERDANADLPVPSGAGPSPLAADPDTVIARRDDPREMPSDPVPQRSARADDTPPSATEPTRVLDAGPTPATDPDTERGTERGTVATSRSRRGTRVLDGIETD